MGIKSVGLCIPDGLGNGVGNIKYNAISNANSPCWKYISSNYQKCNLSASETDVKLIVGLIVGLPGGQINK